MRRIYWEATCGITVKVTVGEHHWISVCCPAIMSSSKREMFIDSSSHIASRAIKSGFGANRQ